jgi:hypothetical protein
MGKLILGIAREVNIPEGNLMPVGVGLGSPPLIGLYQKQEYSQDRALGYNLPQRPTFLPLNGLKVLP